MGRPECLKHQVTVLGLQTSHPVPFPMCSTASPGSEAQGLDPLPTITQEEPRAQLGAVALPV